MTFSDFLATTDEKQMSLFGDGNITPVNSQRSKGKTTQNATKTNQTIKVSAKDLKPQNDPKNASKSNVIQFPKSVPTVNAAKTTGNATYDDCVKKFDADRKKFVDADSQYVIDGLLELCKVDSNFRNRVMLDCKSYGNAYIYLMNKVSKGIGAYKSGNMAMMDKDTALGLCINYFNEDEKPVEKPIEKIAKSTPKKTSGFDPNIDYTESEDFEDDDEE